MGIILLKLSLFIKFNHNKNYIYWMSYSHIYIDDNVTFCKKQL